MPATVSDKEKQTFDQMLEGLKGRVPQELIDRVSTTFAEISNVPEAVQFFGQGFMMRRDAERVWAEARSERAQLQAERQKFIDAERRVAAYEQHIRSNAQNMTSEQVASAQNEILAARNAALRAEANFNAIKDALEEANIWGIFESNLPSDETTLPNAQDAQDNQPPSRYQPVYKEPAMPVNPPNQPPNAPPNAPPQNNSPLEYVTAEQMKAVVQEASMQAFHAGRRASLVAQDIASELSRLTGKPVSAVELSDSWAQSGKDWDTYVNESYNLRQLREEEASKQRAAEIEAEVQKRLTAERTKQVIAGVPGSSSPRSPLFQGFRDRQAPGLQTINQPNQPNQPQPNAVPANGANAPNSPSSPANGGLPSQPNLSNQPSAHPQSTVERVAAALTEGTYSDQKFDLSRDLLRP